MIGIAMAIVTLLLAMIISLGAVLGVALMHLGVEWLVKRFVRSK